MGVDVPKGFIFLGGMCDDLHEHKVFKNIGMIACMKSVAVAKHWMVIGKVSLLKTFTL
jgi:hypothetical protein